jgi:hypothetical protein
MDGPFGPGMMGSPAMGMMPMGGRGPMVPGMMDPMGPMHPRPNGMLPGMMPGRGGRGGFRGGMPPAGRGGGGMPFPGRGGSAFAKRPRPDGMPGQRPSGFVGGMHSAGAANKPPYDREVLTAINHCVTPESVLSLWSSGGSTRWVDGHIAHALLVFSKLVDETCPEDVVKACCYSNISVLCNFWLDVDDLFSVLLASSQLLS